MREGVGVFASKAGSSPTPLPLSLRGRSHLFTQKGPLSIIFSNEGQAPNRGVWTLCNGGMLGALVVGRSRDRVCARREALERIGFRAVREGRVGSLPMLAPARSRLHPRSVGGGRSLGPSRGRSHLFTQKGPLSIIFSA